MLRFTQLLLCVSLLLGASTVSSDSIKFELPPESLAQWYKPLNKRQVWLHTMFRLRREMQAVEEYVAAGDRVHVEKWAHRLIEDYNSIATMVPEWRDELEPIWVEKLQHAATTGDFEMVTLSLKKLNHSCRACHDSYQAQSVLLYRVPDYQALKVSDGEQGELSYADLMDQLSLTINRIKIAIEDRQWQAAQRASAQFEQRLGLLQQSCSACHKEPQPEERILGEKSQQLLRSLSQQIEQQAAKPAASMLGKAAVAICARCHGVHRTLGDLKHLFEQ
ncbi:MAG: cytochrome c [Candidatus Polarisedimenticolaceae bacterium]|nr:cytochrome c [Candidatus Polarisedimenticolaceae bacterium]